MGRNYDYIWIDTTAVNQLDVDGDVEPELSTPYYLSVSKKKKHFFVKGFQGIGKKRTPTKWKDVELLCGQGSYASKNDVVYSFKSPIKDYCGIVDEVLSKDGIVSKNSNTCLNSNVCLNLNEMFSTRGEWKSNSYESGRCIAIIPSSDKTCLLDASRQHSCVKSYVILGKTSCKVKCHSCGERKVDCKKHSSYWKQIRAYFELSTTEDNVNYDTIQEYVDDYCADNDLMKKDGYIMRRL